GEAVLLFLGRHTVRLRFRDQGSAGGRPPASAEPARCLRLPRGGLPGSFQGHLLRRDPAAPTRAYLDGGYAGHGAAVLGSSPSGLGRSLYEGRGRALPAPLSRRSPAPPP